MIGHGLPALSTTSSMSEPKPSGVCEKFMEDKKKEGFKDVVAAVSAKYNVSSEVTDAMASGRCGTTYDRKSCSIALPTFPQDEAYARECGAIGGHLCAVNVAGEFCTIYELGGHTCERTWKLTFEITGPAVRPIPFRPSLILIF